MLRLIDIPSEIIHTVLEYVTASDIALLRQVSARLKVTSTQLRSF